MVVNPARIKKLPAIVANQIAAGEVIERPASVVKELLENALDASATAITIEIDYGGLNRIKVIDNGIGILAEDLILAVSSYATSKLTALEDLYKINSMGFRGEALASIASISKFNLTSKPAAQAHAMSINNELGTFKLQETARASGTTIEVRDIFYNVPVRKSFLKSAAIEFQAIEAVVKRFALTTPAIAITLIHNDKKIFSISPSRNLKQTERVQKIFGKNFYEQAIFLQASYQNLKLQGWISNTTYQISQNDKLWIYINRRIIKDKLLNHAIKQAYADFLYPDRYPVCILFLELPPQEIDVNVHPSKHEVRFKEARIVHDFILTQIKKNLKPLSNTDEKSSISTIVPKNFNYQNSWSSPAINTEWLCLNSQFALIFLQEMPYIINVAQIEKERLYKELQKLAKPWPCRPLLVPVSVKLQASKIKLLEQLEEKLYNYGIQFNCIGSDKIILRSIPNMLPQLQIQEFFQALVDLPATSDNEYLNLMLNHYNFDAFLMNADQQLILKDYLLSKKEYNKQEAKCLDLNACYNLFKY